MMKLERNTADGLLKKPLKISTLLGILTYLIALIGYAPLSPFLETVPRFLLPAALVLGLFGDRKGRSLSGRFATAISTLFFAYYALQFSRDNLVDPAANLLTVLLSVRLVAEKKVRHYLQIFALSLFSLAASSLFTLDSLFLVYLLLLLVLIAVALVILTFHAHDSDLAFSREGMKSLLSVAFIMPAGALPLMCLFFMILPRTQYPLWNFLNVAGSRVAGFSEKVQPGAAASVAAVKNAAFRVQCDRLKKEELYWRSAVLNTPTANAWVREEPPAFETGRIAGAPLVHQTIYPEPTRSGYLPALNTPLRFSGIRGSLTGDLVLKNAAAPGRRIRYEVESLPGAEIATPKEIDRHFYLRLPPSLSPRLRSLAAGVAAKGKNGEEKIALLKEYFRNAKLGYANTGLPVSADPLDEFLFVKKRGNCEFFASSFALLLRLAGVPARLVGGYFGGEYNEVGGYYLVTEDMAHVWVEVWLPGKGWVMLDPSTLTTDFRSAAENRETGLSSRLRMYLDSFNYYWNMTVINYDLERQFQLMNRANLQLRRLSRPLHPGRMLLAAGLLTALLTLAVATVRGARVTKEERLLRRFLRIMRRKYAIDILPSTGLHDLAAIAQDPRIDEFVALYGRAVYGDRKLTGDEYRRLCELLRQLTQRRTGQSL